MPPAAAPPCCCCSLLLPPLLQAQVRYLLRVTVARGMGQSVVKDHAFWVRNSQLAPPPGPPIKVSEPARPGRPGSCVHMRTWFGARSLLEGVCVCGLGADPMPSFPGCAAHQSWVPAHTTLQMEVGGD